MSTAATPQLLISGIKVISTITTSLHLAPSVEWVTQFNRMKARHLPDDHSVEDIISVSREFMDFCKENGLKDKPAMISEKMFNRWAFLPDIRAQLPTDLSHLQEIARAGLLIIS